MPSNNENINFQLESAPLPNDYLGDFGSAYSASRGYGWITQESVNDSSPTPIDITGVARDRNAVAAQRVDTLLHMQLDELAAWEYDIANGSYSVTASVGDPSYTDSIHQINVEEPRLVLQVK